MSEQKNTKGEYGCLFDHLKEELEQLPDLVNKLSGNKVGILLKAFLQEVERGNVKDIPQLSLRWPLLGPYHAANG